MFEKLPIPKLDYLKPWKTIPAFVEAYKKAKEAKDKSFFEKIGIFWEEFKKAVKSVEEEKKEVSKDTQEAVKKGVEDTLKDSKEAVALSDKVEGKDKETYEEALATAVSSFEELDETSQGYAYEGLQEVKKAADGKEAKDLTFEQTSSLGAVAMTTLRKFKAKYPEKGKFKEMLDRVKGASDKSKYPLAKLLSGSVLKLFKIADQEQGLKFLKAIGITPSLGDAAASTLGIGKGGDAMEAGNILTSLGNKTLEKADEDKLVAFMKKYIFRHSDEGDVRKAVVLINRMITNGTREITTEQLTDLVFYINDQDYEQMVAVLTGKKTEYAKAA